MYAIRSYYALKSGSDSDGDSVFDLEEALDDALKTLSDLSETYLPLNIWKSLGTWIGNKSEIVYKKTIGNIVQGVGFVWETAHVTYETTKQDILQMKNKNTNYVSQSYSAQIVDFDEFEKMPESKRKKIEDYEDLGCLALLDENAQVEECRALRNARRLLHGVGYDDDRVVLFQLRNNFV